MMVRKCLTIATNLYLSRGRRACYLKFCIYLNFQSLAMGIMIGSPPLAWGLILWFILVTAYSIDVSTQLVLCIAYLKNVIEIQVHFLLKKN